MPNSIPMALADYDPAKIANAAAKFAGKADPYYEVWFAIVNRAIARFTMGLGAFDLADAPYYDYYVDGIPPREAAMLVLSEYDTFGDMF